MDVVKRQEFERVIGNVRKLIRAKQNRMRVNTETLTGGEEEGRELRVVDERVQFLNPRNYNRIVTLPAEENSEHLYFYIFNTTDTGKDLTVKDDESPTPNVIMTISQDEGGVCFCDGASWRGFVGGKT